MSSDRRRRFPTPSLAEAITIALAVALALHAALTTTFWHATRAALSDDGMSYEKRRTQYAFSGMPVDQLAARLTQALPTTEPVALPASITADEFQKQRLIEALYPRPVRRDARFHVGVVYLGEADVSRDFPLADVGGYTLVLRGVVAPGPGHVHAPASDLALHWLGFAACVAGVVGLGIAARFALVRIAGAAGPVPPWVVPLLGALVVAAVTSLATWAQVAVPRGTLIAVGLAALVAAVFRAIASRRKTPDVGLGLRKHWEATLLAALLILLLARVAAFPIVEWDGRSIWLFNAHRLFSHGMLAKAEVAQTDLLWSHPDYPLLFPGWMATFASLEPTFNERMASLGIPVLFAAALILVWQLVRSRIGRIAGSLLTLGFALALDRATAGAYADGYLMLFLVAQFLALSERATEPVGWVAGAAAALTKPEGIVLAGLVALCVVSLTPAWTGRRWWRRAVPLLWLLPGLVHKLWTLSIGVDSIVKGKAVSAIIVGFLPRLSEAVTRAPSLLASDGYIHVRGVVWEGLIGLGATALLWAWRGRPLGPLVRAALAAAALQAAFAFVTIAALPESVNYFVVTALDRLLIHPSALLVLTPLLYATALDDTSRGTATAGSRA